MLLQCMFLITQQVIQYIPSLCFPDDNYGPNIYVHARKVIYPTQAMLAQLHARACIVLMTADFQGVFAGSTALRALHGTLPPILHCASQQAKDSNLSAQSYP